MARLVTAVLALALLLGPVTVFAQGDTPPQFQLIERFAAALNDGDVMGALALLTSDFVLEERDLGSRVSHGPRAVQDRLWELVLDGVRLEVELSYVLDDGRLVVTSEQRWGDSVPEALAPLRSTAVYVVEGGLVASATRLLVPDQRDALMAPALVGTWRGGDRGLVVSFDGDGGFRSAFSQAQLEEAPRDVGSYGLEHGVFTWRSGEATRMCEPDDVGSYHARFIDADTLEWQMIDEACRERYMGTKARLVRMVED